jgi:hypothetical protein
MKLSLLILFLMTSTTVIAQNLMEERIWRVSARKKSIFLDSGVFHKNSDVKSSNIIGIRNSAVNGRGYERIVVDFNTPTIPKLYGHITTNKKLSIDFFDTAVVAAQPQLKDSKYIKSIDFINVDTKSITMEMALKGKTSFDIFYLENPGRLVIDVR